MQWFDGRSLGVRGKGWADAAHPYDRLPAHAEGVVTAAVWELSRQSAGLWLEFRSSAGTLHARCRLRKPPPPEHHYIKYLDLYARNDAEGGRWRWAGVSRHGFMPSGETPLVDGIPAIWRTWRLYLPLTYAVETLEIGVPDDAAVAPAPADSRRPIALYGTSIVHGCAHLSRPGMAWPSIVGRRLDWPIVNLGFSGSARCEPGLGAILAELDPALFVIDPLANMSLELVESNAEPFLRHLLDRHPDTPLVLIADRTHADAWLRPGYADRQKAKQLAFRRIGDTLRQAGATVVHVQGDDLIGCDGEGTTDASHPSDLGAMRYADVVAPILSTMLNRTQSPA
jgi:hypothetical protein